MADEVEDDVPSPAVPSANESLPGMKVLAEHGHDMERLIRESKTNPHLRMLLDLDAVKHPIENGDASINLTRLLSVMRQVMESVR